MAFRIQIRRDDSARWTVNNPILLEGELGYETDTKYMKIGDGTTPWNLLNYWSGGLTGGGLIVKENSITVQSPTNILNFSSDFSVSAGTSNTANVTLLSGGLPSNINVFEDGALAATGATGLNFTGRSGSISTNGKYVNIDIGGNTTSYFSVTATLSGGNFASFSASKGPDGQPLTGPNWNYTLTNSGNNLTVTHNESTKPIALATHGRDTSDIFVNYPFGTSNSGFALSYPTNMNSFTVYGVNSSNTGASASGTVEIVWIFGATV
jgi:hypothetical protein